MWADRSRPEATVRRRIASPQPRDPRSQPSCSRLPLERASGCTMAAMSEATPPTPTAGADPLEAGRTRSRGTPGRRRSSSSPLADRDGQLSGADLESLALAAFFAAQADVELEVKERAFKAYEAEGNELRAAYLALDVARTLRVAGQGRRSPRPGRAAPSGSSVRTATPTSTATWRWSGARAPRRRATSTPRSRSPSGPSRSAAARPTPTSRRAR